MSDLKATKILAPKKLAEHLGVPLSTLMHWRARWGLPYLKLGSRVFFHDDLFAEWALSRKRTVNDSNSEGAE